MKVADLIQEYLDNFPDNDLQCRYLAQCLAFTGPVEFEGRLWTGHFGGDYGIENCFMPRPEAAQVGVPARVEAEYRAKRGASLTDGRRAEGHGLAGQARDGEA